MKISAQFLRSLPALSVLVFISLQFTLPSLRAADATPPSALAASTAATTKSFPAPTSWPQNAFEPLTAERIATLPPQEQPAWRAYLEASAERSRRQPPRNLVDFSPTKPLDAPLAGASRSQGVRLNAPTAWYSSEEARALADHVVHWQTPAGGWRKSGDYSRAPTAADASSDVWSAGTFDNDATISELRFLALVLSEANSDQRALTWRDAFLRGLDYTFAAQYPNGGFPQIYPLAGGYHDAITFNDDAFVHILELFRDIAERRAPFTFISPDLVERARVRGELGLACVLATQIKTPGNTLTAWCQQHDALSLKPCAARNFEPISASSAESAGLVQFLLRIPNPSPPIITSVDAAMTWLARQTISGVTWDREATVGSGLNPSANAPDLWARFYEIGSDRPIFGDRDPSIHYTVTEISLERRKGYAWYTTRPASIRRAYETWKKNQVRP